MCGLVGIIAKNPNKGMYYKQRTMFEEMLYLDTLRGDDSTGAFIVNKYGNVKWAKETGPASSFIENQQFKSTVSDVVTNGVMLVGHNRKATKGATTDENAHPFVESNIIMVHNGTIANQKELHKTAEVDSHAICHAMVEHGVREALGKVDGAYAIIAYDIEKKQLYLARNVQRPLWIGETADFYLIASEPWMFYGAAWRAQIKIVKVKEIPTLKLQTFTLDAPEKDLVLSEEDIDVYTRGSLSEGYWGEDYFGYKFYNTDEKTEETTPPPEEKKQLPALVDNLFPKHSTNMWTVGDVINFVPQRAQELHGKSIEQGYKIEGAHYLYPEVQVCAIENNSSAEEIAELMKQDILVADVKGVIWDSKTQKTKLFVHGCCASTPFVSANGMIVTEEMVLSTNYCTSCTEEITEDIIEDSVVFFRQKLMVVTCPTCVAKHREKNPKWGGINEAQDCSLHAV